MTDVDNIIRDGLRAATDDVAAIDRREVADLLRSAQTTRSTALRSRRRLLGIAAAAVAVITVGTFAAIGRSDERQLMTNDGPSTTWAPRTALRARIEIDTYVESGGRQRGTVIVSNDTGQPIDGHRCGVAFSISLHGDQYSGNDMQQLCDGTFTLPVGESRWPVELSGVSSSCSADPAREPTREVPACLTDGRPPPIPPGRYDATIHGPEGFPAPPRFEARVGKPGEADADMVPPDSESGTASPADGLKPGEPVPVINPLPCIDADPADVAAIAGVLKGNARTLGEAHTYNDGPYRVVVADVFDDQGERLESAETWVFINGGLRAVSSDAADLSLVSKLRIEDENAFRTITGYDVFEVGSALDLSCRSRG